jgi:hypothetical protein
MDVLNHRRVGINEKKKFTACCSTHPFFVKTPYFFLIYGMGY